MHERVAFLVLVLTGLSSCESANHAPEHPRMDSHQATAATSTPTNLPAPTAQASASAEPPPDRPESASSPIPKPEPQCPAPKPQAAPPGALAWVSACFIKTVKQIHFEFDKPMIKADSLPTLDAVAEILRVEQAFHVEIGAHTDGRGSTQYNKALAQSRADAVKNYLVVKGIDSDRLVARGFGDERPISHPPLIEGRRTNRRIEFVILPQ